MRTEMKDNPRNDSGDLESAVGGLWKSFKRKASIGILAGGLALSAFNYGCNSPGNSSKGGGGQGNGQTATYYQDMDRDGYGDPSKPVTLHYSDPAPSGYSENNQDCDDHHKDTYPGAPEACDNRDNDCDGLIDENVKNTYYTDADRDGYGNINFPVQACYKTIGYSEENTDCNDNDPDISPIAKEICDRIDNNCDGKTDDVNMTYFRDADSDGFGDRTSSITVQSCTPPIGYVADNTDCVDIASLLDPATVNPAEEQICDYINNNCSIYEDATCINFCVPENADINIGEVKLIGTSTRYNMLSALGKLSMFVADPYWLKDCQSFSVYNGHNGGTGDTLQIVGWYNSMWIDAEWGSVRRIAVYPGWEGLINGKDVRPGDPIEAFTQNFPDAVQCAEGTYRVNFELTPGTGSGSDPRSLKADYENGIITRIMFDSETNQCTYDGPDLP